MASRIRTFHNLQEALRSRMCDERVFAQEYPSHFLKSQNQGARKFLVGKTIEIWKTMRSVPIALRHFHEVILPGVPVHPFFDLDMAITDSIDSPHANELDACVEEIIGHVAKQLGVEINQEESVDLNGSRIGKCSRHLHLHLSGSRVFKNINHLRYFVQSIIQHSGVSVALQESIDIAVYYEKKSLRTFLSTKKSLTSSSNPLLSTERFEASSRTDLEIFQNSLICVVDDQPSDGPRPMTNLIPWPRPQHHSLYDPLRTSEDDEAHMALTAPSTSHLQSGRERSCFKDPIYSSQPITPRKTLADDTGYIANLPKEVQRWFSKLSRGASVASHKINFPYEVFVSMSGGFCRRIGRKHKSNRTFYLIDLAVGHVWQKCYDPDCKMYTSEAIKMPDHVKGLLLDSCPGSLPEIESPGWIKEYFRQSPQRILNCLVCSSQLEPMSSNGLHNRLPQSPLAPNATPKKCASPMETNTERPEGSHLNLQSREITLMKMGLAVDDKSSGVSNTDLVDLYTWDVEIENQGRSPKTPATKSKMPMDENKGQAESSFTRRPLRELPIPFYQQE